MHKTCTQKKTVVRDGQSKHIHLERMEDTPESLKPDDLQQHLHHLLQRYCTPEVEEEKEEEAEELVEREEKQDTDDWFSITFSFICAPKNPDRIDQIVTHILVTLSLTITMTATSHVPDPFLFVFINVNFFSSIAKKERFVC